MSYVEMSSTLGVWSVVAMILAIAATVLAYIFIVPEKKREKLNPFCKFLHDTCNFKYLIVEKILQALYIFLTAYIFIAGFFMLFSAPEDWWTGRRHWMGGYGILLMLLGPIVVRLVYELLMMAILLLKNVISINGKLKNQNEGSAQSNLFVAPDMSDLRQQVQAKMTKATQPAQPVQPTQPAAPRFCSRCGAALNPDGKCPHCDNPDQN